MEQEELGNQAGVGCGGAIAEVMSSTHSPRM